MGDSRVQQFVPLKKDGTSIKTKVPGDSPEVDNDTWTKGTNYAGTSEVNMFKVTEDDEIEVGGTLVIGASLVAVSDSGAITIFDMPVSATPAAGTEMSGTFKIDGDNILKVYSEANGVGGTQNPKVIAECGLNLKEITTPDAKADYGAIYTKTNNKLYFQDGAGAEHEIAFV